MSTVPILQPPITHWECERCPARDQTRDARVHTRFHHCRALGGALVPMVVAGAGSRVLLREREDYVGSERVQLINNRPVMAAVTEHADGRVDSAVFAPAATASGSM